MYNDKKYIEIVFDMTIIAFNMMNVIKMRLHVEDVVAGLDDEPQSVLSVFQRQPIDNLEAQKHVHATAIGKKRGVIRKSVARKSSRIFQRPNLLGFPF